MTNDTTTRLPFIEVPSRTGKRFIRALNTYNLVQATASDIVARRGGHIQVTTVDDNGHLVLGDPSMTGSEGFRSRAHAVLADGTHVTGESDTVPRGEFLTAHTSLLSMATAIERMVEQIHLHPCEAAAVR